MDNTIEKIIITKEFIKEFLPDNPIVLEAGAHIGRDTIKMSNLWPNGIIYAFEPVNELYQELQKKTMIKNNIICFNFALTNKSGNATMYISSGRSTALSSLLEPVKNLVKNPETYFRKADVKTITIDSWAKKYNIKKIDFMWLDMQGSELNALQGGINILKNVNVIFIEANLTERYKNVPLYNQLKSWLENHNFRAIAQDKPKHEKINILFIHKNLTKMFKI